MLTWRGQCTYLNASASRFSGVPSAESDLSYLCSNIRPDYQEINIMLLVFVFTKVCASQPDIAQN